MEGKKNKRKVNLKELTEKLLLKDKVTPKEMRSLTRLTWKELKRKYWPKS